MWILYVLSIVGSEIKWTMYDEYKTYDDCHVQTYVLEARYLVDSEAAFCFEEE